MRQVEKQENVTQTQEERKANKSNCLPHSAERNYYVQRIIEKHDYRGKLGEENVAPKTEHCISAQLVQTEVTRRASRVLELEGDKLKNR